jgi:hypothetical protein
VLLPDERIRRHGEEVAEVFRPQWPQLDEVADQMGLEVEEHRDTLRRPCTDATAKDTAPHGIMPTSAVDGKSMALPCLSKQQSGNSSLHLHRHTRAWQRRRCRRPARPVH